MNLFSTKSHLLMLFIICALCNTGFAQSTTINTTVGSTGYNGSNNSGANSFITFLVENTGSVDLKITEVGNWCQTLHNNTQSTLWYSSTSLGGAVTLAGPDWTSVATATVSGVTTSGVHPVLTGINFVVPAGATYRLAVATNASQNNYTLGTPTPNNFSAGGMTLYTGNHQVNSQNVGYAGGNNPRFFTGYISFEPAAIPCDDTLTSAVVLGKTKICPDKGYNLSVGLQNGVLISGLTYQWQYSNNGINWSNFTGVPNIPKGGEIRDSIKKDKYYRCVLTCSATGMQFITPPHKVSIAPFYYCYCDSRADEATDANIGNLTIINSSKLDTIYSKADLFTGTGLPVYSNGNASNTYTSYHDSLAWPCLYRDSSFIYSISQIHTNNTFKTGVLQAFVDYNRDGLYDPNNERILVHALDGNDIPPYIYKNAITVPSNAQIGPTGLRLVLSEDTLAASPCGIIPGSGEVEDYIIDICDRPCDTAVNAGTVLSTDTSMCGGYEYRLTDTTYEQNRSGFSRAWQVSGDLQTWTNLANSLDKDTLERVFAGQPLHYRVRTICTNTHDTNYSAPQLINVKPSYKCYCYSKATGGPGIDTSDIGGVTIANYSSNNGGPHLLNKAAVLPRTDFTDITPIELFTDSLYKFYVYHTMPVQEHGDAKITIFMDFNNNNEYDIPDERIYTGYTTIGNHTLIDNVIIPYNAITDVPTGMRVIVNNDVGPNVPSDEGCGGYVSGETEDYLLIFRRKWAQSVNETMKLGGFGVHPNPTSGKFYVQFSTNSEISEVNVRVTGITGQLIQEHSYEHKGGMFYQQLDMSGQSAGIYFVELIADGQRLQQKLIVQ